MKIAIYGGTFDPIHHGHLILAREAVEQLELERVIFVPAAISPHKLTTQPTRAETRLEMLRAAVAGELAFGVDELELRRTGPSFTIDTVRALQHRHPNADWIYLIGQDNVAALSTWRDFTELERLVEFVVFSRGESGGPIPYRTLGRQVEISATDIRRRVASGASIRYLVPEAVREIIVRENLYQEPHPSNPNS